MSDYLRPETLFSNKFEGYLNQKEGTNNQEPEHVIPIYNIKAVKQ